MADETELFYTPVSKVVLFATLLVSVSDLHKGLSSFVFPVKQITQNPLVAIPCGFDPRRTKNNTPLNKRGIIFGAAGARTRNLRVVHGCTIAVAQSRRKDAPTPTTAIRQPRYTFARSTSGVLFFWCWGRENTQLAGRAGTLTSNNLYNFSSNVLTNYNNILQNPFKFVILYQKTKRPITS